MDSFVSTIYLWPLNWAPRNYQNCAGQTLSISQNAALFSLLGTQFGGNGVSTFQLPDFRGRIPVGYNPGGAPGVSVNTIGEIAGTEQTTLLISNMPAHTHIGTVSGITGSLSASTTQASLSTPAAGNVLGAGWDPNNADSINTFVTGTANVALGGLSIAGGTVTNSITGNSLPFSIQSPYLVVNYIIAIYGIFPSRN